jgi:hypothetical protein
VNPAQAREARRLAFRYLSEVVERFELCPWAAPARVRGELWMDVVDADDAEAAIGRFLAAPGAVIGLIIVPTLDGPPARLRALRDELLAGPVGREVALADFHPAAALDRSHPNRLVPFLRRSPDPMLQAVRHRDLASLHRARPMMSPADQAAVLAGKPVPAFRDPVAEVATSNLRTIEEHTAELVALLDDIHADRARTYAALAAAAAAQ